MNILIQVILTILIKWSRIAATIVNVKTALIIWIKKNSECIKYSDVCILTSTLKCKVPNDLKTHEIKTELKISFDNRINKKDIKINEDVTSNYYRCLFAEILKRSIDLSDDENYIEAEDLLKSFKDLLENTGIKNQKINNILVDLNEALEMIKPINFNDFGNKRLHEYTKCHREETTTKTGAAQYSNKLQAKLNNMYLTSKNNI